MNREAILEICGVKEVFEVPQTLMKKLFSHEQSEELLKQAKQTNLSEMFAE